MVDVGRALLQVDALAIVAVLPITTSSLPALTWSLTRCRAAPDGVASALTMAMRSRDACADQLGGDLFVHVVVGAENHLPTLDGALDGLCRGGLDLG